MTSDRRASIDWHRSQTVAENAKRNLPELARQFLDAGHAAAAPGAPLEKMHPFRLLTKRFRYTLEPFEPYYGSGLKRRIDALRKLQDLLGAISDCSATQELLRERRDLPASERNPVLRSLKQMAASRIGEFRGHWQENYSQPLQERWWTDYLARFARPRRG